jgi:hypothetical protein
VDTYKIIRNHQDTRKASEVIETGLTLEEAQAHCRRPDTRGGHAEAGTAWFDGFEVEA